MKNILLAGMLFYFSFFSCTKRLCACDPVAPPSIKAVVVETNNTDCSRPRISIDVSDTAEVSRITGVYTDMYIASQLPADLKTTGQKLYISVSQFGPGEDFSCTTLGPAYAHLKLYQAVKRN